jgi:DNA end-binding protein Ku
MWSGSLSFGLVNIPVKLYTAVKEERVAFHMLHDQDHVRLQRKMVCPADGKEIHPEHIVKGYEVAPDQYVIVSAEELEALAPEKSRNIDITDFVDLTDIDPMYYDRPYYLLPGPNAARPYRLLVEAMTKSGKVGIARFVMRDKEYLAAIRPVEDVLCLETMHFGNEVLPAEEIDDEAPSKVHVGERELKVAQQFIESLSTEFQPKKYHDDYQERVKAMLAKKAKGEDVVTPPPVERKAGKAVDLMAALEASLAQARGKAGVATAHAPVRQHHHHERRRRKSA